MASKTKSTTPRDEGAKPKTSSRKRSATKKASPKDTAAKRKPVKSVEPSENGTGPALVIVESPKKAKSIHKFLGRTMS